MQMKWYEQMLKMLIDDYTKMVNFCVKHELHINYGFNYL